MSDVLVQERAVRRKGPVVTFSGVDGAGKTTLALVAADELRRQGYRVRILRVYPFSVTAVAGWMWNTLTSSRTPRRREPASERRSGALVGLWKRLVFRVDCFLLAALIRFLTGRGIAVVCDRYAYDSLVRLFLDGAVNHELFGRWANRVPAPDAAFLLRAGENVIGRRRGNTDLERIRSISEYYLKLVDFGDFWIVDTDDGARARSEVRGILSYAGRGW